MEQASRAACKFVIDGKVSYVDLKKASGQFEEAKDKINASFEEARFGKW